LKLACDEPLSDFAFTFNLRRYIVASDDEDDDDDNQENVLNSTVNMSGGSLTNYSRGGLNHSGGGLNLSGGGLNLSDAGLNLSGGGLNHSGGSVSGLFERQRFKTRSPPGGEQRNPAHADADASLDGLHMQNVNALAASDDDDDDDDADDAAAAAAPAANAHTATAAAFAAADEPPFDEPLDTSVASAQSGRSVDRSGVSEAKSTASGRRGPRGLMAGTSS